MTSKSTAAKATPAYPTADAWDTSHAVRALADAITAAKLDPILRAAHRASLDTLRAALAGCGMNSTPADNARGCTPADALVVIAATARSLAKPNRLSECARTTLSCAFTTMVTVLKGIGAVPHV